MSCAVLPLGGAAGVYEAGRSKEATSVSSEPMMCWWHNNIPPPISHRVPRRVTWRVTFFLWRMSTPELRHSGELIPGKSGGETPACQSSAESGSRRSREEWNSFGSHALSVVEHVASRTNHIGNVPAYIYTPINNQPISGEPLGAKEPTATEDEARWDKASAWLAGRDIICKTLLRSPLIGCVLARVILPWGRRAVGGGILGLNREVRGAQLFSIQSGAVFANTLSASERRKGGAWRTDVSAHRSENKRIKESSFLPERKDLRAAK